MNITASAGACTALVANDFDTRDALSPVSTTRLRARRIHNPALTECDGIVHGLARRLSPWAGMPVDDLVQEGRCAVVLASETWTPANGRFSTFAFIVVKRWMLRVGNRERRRGITGGFVNRRYVERSVMPLDDVGGGDDGVSLYDTLGRDADQEDAYAEAEHRAQLRVMIDALPKRDRDIIRMVAQGRSHEQIGHRVGLTRERVRQLVHGLTIQLATGRSRARSMRRAKAGGAR
jgi:RNA polymerase sigma factor (sigma-70 family)